MISVIIPSHKSISSIFEDTLMSLEGQDYPKDKYEVIVVENPKSVEVKEFVEELLPDNFLCLESELGSNNARNKGISEAKFSIIALTDDDTILPENWLETIDRVFTARHSMGDEVSCIGGPLIPKFLGEKPRWLEGELLGSLSYTNHPPADSPPRPLKYDLGEWLVSANLAFPKDVWESIGGFDGDIGLHGLEKNTSNDEILFTRQCKAYGQVLYVTSMKAEHQIPESRACSDYILEREYGQGRADAELYFSEYPEKSVEDAYHDLAQGVFDKIYQFEKTYLVRDTISNEEATRQYIRNVIKAKLSKMVGLVNKLEGKDIWVRNKDE